MNSYFVFGVFQRYFIKSGLHVSDKKGSEFDIKSVLPNPGLNLTHFLVIGPKGF